MTPFTIPLRGARTLLLLAMPLLIMSGILALTQSTILQAKGADPPYLLPSLAPPTNLQIVALDSSFHVTWTPSGDPSTAWHVVSVWDGSTLQQPKVVSKTSRAAQTNGLMSGHTYTVKVQAMTSTGGLSTAIGDVATTDPQSPMPNAAFFENFNEPAGDLDYNYFDVRTSHGVDLQPESIGNEKMLVFNNENHFHTQLIGGKQRAELYIRPRLPFDFANRTGTMQFEVDTAAVQHSEGKWLEIHLVRNIPWSAEEFGAGNGEHYPDSIEFSVRQGNGNDQMNVNLPQITVNIGGVVSTFQGTSRQLTPANIRMPVVLQVSSTSAEMFINGVSVVRATGFTLPFTTGYWMLAHRGWYASRDHSTSPIIVQLIHWETIQYDGPQGSFNPVVKTYLQSGCGGVVHNEHDGIQNCPTFNMNTQHRAARLLMMIQDDTSQWQTAKIMFNGVSDTGAFNLIVNGHRVRVPTYTCCFLNTLNTYDFPASWLRLGANVVTLAYAGIGDAEISQVELEVVTNQPRVMENPTSMAPMPMLGVTTQNFRIDHTSGDPMVNITNTFLYSLGASAPLNYNAATVSSESPWLTVSPSDSTIRSPAMGFGMVRLSLAVDFTNIPVDSDGQVGVIKIIGGNMPLYIGVLAVNDGTNPPPQFIQSFTGANTTFNKNAIPGYHSAP